MNSDFQICQYDNSYDFTRKTPRFFKIILENTVREGRLEIPPGFVKKFGNCLWSPMILMVPTGYTWQVELSRIRDEIWLEKGWKEFSDHHSLKHGHLLVFQYKGPCHFNVLIFDMSAVEVDYPNNDCKSQPEMEEIIEIRETQSRDENILHSDLPIQEFGGNQGDIPLRSEVSRAPDISNNCTSSNPWFKFLFKSTPAHRCVLWIRFSFIQKHMECKTRSVMLKVEDKSWHVKLRVYLHSRTATLTTGWSTFVRDNFLKKRDVCVFELINKNVLNVSIFRHLGRMVDQ